MAPTPRGGVTIAWLDAFTANVDRTWRNPNLLVWHRSVWAIDHGAALVFQHAWGEVAPWSTRSYGLAEHVLTPVLADVRLAAWIETGATLAAKVTPDLRGGLLDLVPDAWLETVPGAAATRRAQENDPASPPTPQQLRERYVTYLLARRDAAETWWQGGPS